MIKRYLISMVCLLVMGAGLAACGDDPVDDDSQQSTTCATHDDCSDGHLCSHRGLCLPESGEACTNDLECNQQQAGTYCADGTCRPTYCAADDDCLGANICERDRCRTGCRQDQDCDQGEECSAGFVCVENTGCSSDFDCQQHRRCDDTTSPPECVPDGTCTTDTHCTSYERHIDDGEVYICGDDEQCMVRPPCESDDQCEDGQICVDGDCPAGCRADDDCLLGEYCSEDFKCVTGCNSDADCTEDGDVCVDLECRQGCASRDECDAGWICTGEPAHCQQCEEDNQCYGVEFCDLEADATADDTGLCRDLPPECPEDDFGDNQDAASPYVIDQFPFEQIGDHDSDAGPFFCRENRDGEWFSVQVDPGKVVVAEIEYDVSGGNLDLALLDDQENDLRISSRPPAEDAGIERIEYGIDPDSNGPADLLIQVRGNVVDPKVPYRLTVDVRDPLDCPSVNNDSPADATALAVETAHEDLEVCGGQSAWFSLDVTAANQIVTVEALTETRLGAVDLYLYDDPQSGALVWNDTDRDRKSLDYEAISAGEFFLEVVLRDGAGRAEFDLRWSVIDNECWDPLETNDSCAEAHPLDDGDSHSDLNICSDDDWYSVVLRPLDRLTVTATYDPPNAAGELQLNLVGPNDCSQTLQSANDYAVGGSTERQLIISDPNDVNQGFEAQVGGTYYIFASRFSGLRVPYSLDVDIQSGATCADDRFDEGGNDNGDAAGAVLLDETEIVSNGPQSALVGLRICDYDQDWFELTIDNGQTLKWEIVHDDAEGAIDAELVDSDGTTTITDTNGDPVTLDANGVIEWTNQTGSTNTYYLKVMGADGLPVRNNYWLLSWVDDSGPANTTCPDVFEPNDDSASATELDADTYEGLLICGGNDDWYRTAVEAGETIEVSITFAHADGNIDLSLYEDSDLSNHHVQSATSSDVETVTYASARDQYVYYRVNTSSGVDWNDYDLDVSVTPATGCSDDGFAPNTDSNTAAGVEAPGLYGRLMKCEDTSDWFEVDLTDGQLFEAYINYDDSRAELEVAVYAPSDLSNPAATGLDAATYTPATDGVHYVEVRSAGSSRSRLGYDLLLYRDLDDDGTFDADEGPVDRDCPDAFGGNDTTADAAEVPAGSYADLLLCSGQPIDRDDYFNVYVPSGATLSVDLFFAHSDGDIDLELYDSTSSIVDHSRSSDDDESVTATNNSSLGQEYIVRVYGGGSFQNYYTMDVGLAFGSACVEDAFGQTNDAGSAAALSAGSYDLTLCEATEDWFSFDLADGESVEAHVELRNRLGNIDVELYDGSDLNNPVDSSETDDNLESVIHTHSGATQTYYLRIFPRDGAFMRNDYDLWVAVGAQMPDAPHCPDPYERNDTTEAAYGFDFGTTSQLAEANMCSTEVDWYQVDLSAFPTYEFSVFYDYAADFELGLEVRDENGNVLDDEDGNAIEFASYTADDDEIVAFSPPSSGTYFLGVKQMGSDVGAEGDYFVYFDNTSTSCPDDSYEPNDSPATAADLPSAGTHALGLCGGAGEADYFWYTPQTDDEVELTIYHDSDQLGVYGEVLSNNKTFFLDTSEPNRATFTVPAADVTAGSDIRIYVESTSGAGPYFLKIDE